MGEKAGLKEEGRGLLQAHTLACEESRWQLGRGGKLLRFSELRKPLVVEKPLYLSGET